MDTYEFDFKIGELDGIRLIRLAMPERIPTSSLAANSASYLVYWDDERPTVGLGDIRELREMNDDVLQAFIIFARRVTVLPSYVGSAWFTGPDNAITTRLRAIALAAGRDPDSVVETEAEAIRYLRERIRNFKSTQTEPDANRPSVE